MENLIKIMPQTYIISTQAGWKKLLRQLDCYHNRNYNYQITQCTTQKEAFENILSKYDNKIYQKPLQYPIKYPCIITFQNETFEHSCYYIFIKYINKEVRDILVKL